MNFRQMLLLLIAASLSTAVPALAASQLDISYNKNLSNGVFGPFTPTQDIPVIATFRNTSLDQTITICEGACIGDNKTYSLGAQVWITQSIAPYGFVFGNGNDNSMGWLNNQIAGTLLPGQSKDVIVGIYKGNSLIMPGEYSYIFQVSIYDATPERARIDEANFIASGAVIPSPPVTMPPTSVPVMEGWWLLPGMLAGISIFARRRNANS